MSFETEVHLDGRWTDIQQLRSLFGLAVYKCVYEFLLPVEASWLYY